MSEYVTAQCGACRKTFRLRSDQRGRNVQCPHCKAVVKIALPREPLSTPADALRGIEPPDRDLVLKHGSPRIAGGIRSRWVAIVWVAILGVLAVVLAVLLGGGFVQRWIREQEAANRPADTGPVTPVAIQGLHQGVAKPVEQDPAEPEYPVQVEEFIRGFEGQTRTLLAGKVTNLTEAPIRAMVITIPVHDAAKTKIGDASAVIRDLPVGKSAVLVAIWDHDATARAGGYGAPDYQIDAPQALRPPANLECRDPPWTEEDPHSDLTPRGTITQEVINLGTTAVDAVEMSAILRDAEGKIVGAAKGTVRLKQKLLPEKTASVVIPYEYVPRDAIRKTEVWVQAAD